MRTRQLQRLLSLWILSAGALWPALTHAQLPTSDLQSIYPPVARAGSSVEVTVAGEHLDGLTMLRFDDARIKAPPVLRDDDPFYPEHQKVPHQFKVEVPAAVEPGIFEVRSLGHFGLSTARPFLVVPADFAEELEPSEPHDTPQTAAPLAIETGLTGKLDVRKADWYRFTAKKGERLLAQVWGERLDARTDAMLSIFDSAGRELETNREYFGRDPLIDFTAPADGEYLLTVADILHRGGSGYFYRLKISRAPHIDFIDPPAGIPGTTTRFTIYGRNLPGGSPGEGTQLDGKTLETLEVDIAVPATPESPTTFTSDTPRSAALPAFEYALANSNTVRIGFATAPLVKENPAAELQVVTADCEIIGGFDEPGDADYYRFTAAPGKTYHAEVISEQMGALTDAYLRIEKITTAEGDEVFEQIAESDDPVSFFDPANLDATYLDHVDSGVTLQATEQATDYRIVLLNQLGGAGPKHRYRLAIREARPDFLLITTSERNLANGRAGYPAAHLVRQGGSITYRVIAPRRDGFEGEIVVRASNLPAGVTAKPLRLNGDSEEGFLTVVAARDAPAWQGRLAIIGTATIDGMEVKKRARNAALVWGDVFADSRRVRSRLDKEIALSVTDRETAPALVEADAKLNETFQVHLNESLKIPIKVTDFGTRTGNLTVQMHGFPRYGKTPPSTTIAEGKTDGEISINFAPRTNFPIEPGRYQFVLQGIGNAKYRHYPEHADHLAAEHQRFIQKGKDLTVELESAKKTEAEARAALDAVRANAATATADQKSALDKQIADAEAALTAASQTVRITDTALKRAEQLHLTFANLAAAAKTKATEKSTKFATFSQPIDVEVLPAKEEEKK